MPPFQVLFSSVASLLGSAGQASYSAANAGMDGFAAKWAGAGTPMASVQWGAWAGAGMAASNATTAVRLQRLGLGLLSPEQGLQALDSILSCSQSASVQAAAVFDWGTLLRSVHPSSRAMFTEVVALSTPCPPTNSEAPDTVPLLAHDTVSAGKVKRSWQVVMEQVQDAVEAVLGQVVGPQEPLMAAGLDSLGAVELHSQLQVHIVRNVSRHETWDLR